MKVWTWVVGWVIALAPLGAQAAGDEYAAARMRAVAASNALARGQAKAYRLAVTEPIAALPWLEREALVEVVRATVDVAIERGAQGLEGLLASSLAALAARDFDGWVAADAELWRLAERWWIAKGASRPNAVVAVARPGSPVVHYLPIGLGRALVQGQMETGRLDIEGALGASVCDGAAIGELTQRYGARMGALLERLCGDGATGGGATGGDLGLGFGSELSLVDCLMAAQETRAERIGSMMQACAESLLDVGQGNPLADGTPGDEVPPIIPNDPPPYDPFTQGTQSVEDPESRAAELDAKARAETEVTFYGEKDGDRAEVFVDEDGDMVWGDVYEDGKRTQSVELRDDNSYVVRDYDKSGNVVKQQEYGPDGKPVGAATSDSPGMDYGDTAECRALTIALMGERAASVAVEAGALDPRTAYPTPDADPEEAADLACLGLAAGPTLDAGFGCNAEVALCPPGQLVGAGCGCKPAGPMLEPSRQCGMFMRCEDGLPTVAEDGRCTCGDVDALFVDAGAGPLPLPARTPDEPGTANVR